MVPLLLLLLPLTSPLATPGCPSLSPSLSYLCHCHHTSDLTITCSGLNSTSVLATLPRLTGLTITDSHLPCLTTAHLPSSLTSLTVTASGLTSILCPSSTFFSLPSLTSLNLSNNSLRSLDRSALRSLPPSLASLGLQGNPLPCSPSLAWVAGWAAALPATVRAEVEALECQVELGRQEAPLVAVMEVYRRVVTPACPPTCSCHFYHFAERPPEAASYTVRVNCSARQLTTFPTLPADTTVLDLSHNLLNQAAYEALDVVGMNYINLESLTLSHNLLTTIHMKLFKLKLHRVFRADHNSLTELPYDFSQLLQNYDTKNVTLGHNRWQCSCNAEIADTSLQRKVKDLWSVVCAEGSVPEAIVGRRLTEVDQALLCPPSEKEEQKQMVMKAICVVLATLIVVIMTKLLYDWWEYRTRGKLPCIVYRMP